MIERIAPGAFPFPISFWKENGPQQVRSDKGYGIGPWGIPADEAVPPVFPSTNGMAEVPILCR